MKKVALIEDEVQVASFIKKGLSEEGFEVSIAFDGKTGLQMIQSSDFDIVIIDIMLPELNGLEICKEFRKTNHSTPILFLTALGTSENVVVGLEAGADDYLVKPFKFIELTARIKTLLRRYNYSPNPAQEKQENYLYKIADLELNDYTKTVTRAGEVISLTTTEYKLLYYFLKNKKRVLSRSDILEEVWSVNFDMGTNVVDVYVNYLRKKIDSKYDKKLIHTVVGMGYVIKDE